MLILHSIVEYLSEKKTGMTRKSTHSPFAIHFTVVDCAGVEINPINYGIPSMYDIMKVCHLLAISVSLTSVAAAR